VKNLAPRLLPDSTVAVARRRRPSLKDSVLFYSKSHAHARCEGWNRTMRHGRGFSLLFFLLSGLAALARQAAGAEVRPPLFEARPCREVVTALAPEGIRVRVDDALREDKVTLAVRQPSWERERSALAQALGAEWVTHDDNGKHVLVLRPTKDRVRVFAAAERRRRENWARTAEVLLTRLNDRLTGRVNPYRGSAVDNPQALDALRDTPPAVLKRALEFPNPPFNGSEGAKAPTVAISASRLGPAGQAAVRKWVGSHADFLAQRDPESANVTYFRKAAADLQGVRIELWCNEPARRGDTAELFLKIRTARGGFGETPLAFGGSAADDTPLEDLGESVASAIEDRKIDLPAGSYRLDRAQSIVARQAHVDLVSDYFTRGGTVTVGSGAHRLGDVLDRLDEAARMRHSWSGGILVFRSRRWYDLIDREPPAVVTDLLEARASKRETPTFGELLQIAASATDRQLATLERHVSSEGKPLPLNWSPRLQMNARWLRAYAGLSEQQRGLVGAARGLNLGGLPVTQRPAWEFPLTVMGLEPSGAGVIVRLAPGKPPQLDDWTGLPRVVFVTAETEEPLDLWRNAMSY
jgi:hypothetical protein